MKNSHFFSVLLLSFLSFHAAAQSNYTEERRRTDSLTSVSLTQIQRYIMTDTLDLKLTETEKNSVNHTGETHQLVPALARGAAAEGPSSGSWDKFLPTVYHKEATVGSPFLLFLYVPGLVVNNSYEIVNKKDQLYNYDKMSGNFLMKRGNEAPIAVFKEQVKMFCLKTDQGGFIFMRVPMISSYEFFQLISRGSKYSCYKLYKSKFVKSNQATNGYSASGKDYDEYQDIVTYYLVDEIKELNYPFELKRKSVKKVFDAVNASTEEYFNQHRYDEVDELYVAKLIEKMNN